MKRNWFLIINLFALHICFSQNAFQHQLEENPLHYIESLCFTLLFTVNSSTDLESSFKLELFKRESVLVFFPISDYLNYLHQRVYCTYCWSSWSETIYVISKGIFCVRLASDLLDLQGFSICWAEFCPAIFSLSQFLWINNLIKINK